ncbi:hypothetical protein BKN37_12915 [Mycobacterium talmoniae]|uniref:DUF1877 domain-containing protein n=1 Tax=Mycobacterium talmoniae TaxID=1858794 RepID=A0A1S1NL01_9MYCO|nr:hypothetical protein BKN37_12915 [Mycobacterium talmoniae]
MKYEYFLAETDESAAQMLETGPTDGVLGPDPVTELVSLEAILKGLDPSSDEAMLLMSRPGHGRTLANDGTDSVMILGVLDEAVSLIATAEPDRITSAMQPWAETEELAGRVTAAELAEVTEILRALFERALVANGGVYVRLSL